MATVIACTTSLSVPASSPGDRVPSPAANDQRRVAPSAVGIFRVGAQRRVEAASVRHPAVSAGQAEWSPRPISLRLVKPKETLFVISRVDGSLPFATSFLTNLPD